MKAPIYDTKGKEIRTFELPESVFGAPRNDALVYQAVLAMEANARTPVANTKGRGEVSGGGKKPWKQKGTGRARHGSIRSPIWRGGGTTHGPLSERDFSQKLNKKMRAKALATVLSARMKEGKILFVDSLTFAKPATKEAKGALDALSKVKGFTDLSVRRKNAALITLGKRDTAAEKSFRNMGNIKVMSSKDLNPVAVLSYKYLVVADPEASVEAIAARMK